jgi:hypothetical protein
MALVLDPGLGRSAVGIGKVRLSDPGTSLSHAIGNHLKICLGFRLKGPAHSAPCRLGVKGGCRRQVDGTAGLPSAPEMPCAPRQLRLVPQAEPE